MKATFIPSIEPPVLSSFTSPEATVPDDELIQSISVFFADKSPTASEADRITSLSVVLKYALSFVSEEWSARLVAPISIS